MVGANIVLKRGNRDEAEKPFWISFADLMTALMVLFLVVMGVALLAVTRSEEHTSELQSQFHLVCRLLLEKKNTYIRSLFNAPATTHIYTLSLHDALPISTSRPRGGKPWLEPTSS